MKSKLIPIILGLACASLARADFNPVPLTPSSFTYDIVVESNTIQALPFCINVTAGNGTGLGDNTYYEQGLYARAGQTGGNSGVPPHNSVFASINNASMTFVMPPDYTTNNDLMIDGTFGSGTFTFNTPTSATNLVLLGCGGGGATTFGYTVTHADTTTETGSSQFPDWFNGGATVVWGANGRITSGGGYNNFNNSTANTGAPYLYGNKITVSGASPIVSIAFTFTTGQHANIFGVSGNSAGSTWTPIPVGGFNVMALVPATFPLTATMDQGTNTSQNGNLATWFEQGYVTNALTAGLPPSGSTFNSFSQPSHHYQMGNYSTNNAILIDTNHQIANITPVTPGNFTAYAFLTAGGNVGGTPMQNYCILQHADGVNETNIFFGYDWFNTGAPGAIALKANGRVNMSGRTVNNVNNGFPYLFETYFTLVDISSPVTNIVVKYKSASSTNATTYIMAISSSTDPVPPVITSGPTPSTQSWYPTQSASITAQSAGSLPLTNFWMVQIGTDVNSNGVYAPLVDGVDANGSVISGSGTTTLTINNLTLADSTNYVMVAANFLGRATSSPSMLIVNTTTPQGPIITAQSPNSPFSVLTNHVVSTTFSVTVDTNTAPPIFYQWFNTQGGIAGATNATYVNVDTNATTIYCAVSNFVATVTNNPISFTFFTKPALSPYQSAVFAYNPVAYWPLSETDGNIAYDYAGTNDGVYTGNFSLNQPGLPATVGIGANTSAYFDGGTAYIDVPGGDLNLTNAMTILQWVAPPSGQDTGFTTTIGHSDQGYRLDVVGGQAHFADAGPDIVSPTLVNDNNWHLLVGVYDGTNQLLYVDGQLSGTPHTGNPGTGNAGSHVRIGGAPDYGNRFFMGNIAQVAILPTALSAAQVTAIYNALDTPPTVAIIPANPSVFAGASVTFTAQLSGTPATQLQWFMTDTLNNTTIIAGATNATYTISNIPLSYNGYNFGIIAANAYGTNTAYVNISVQNGPAYLGGDIMPLNAEAYAGAAVTYTVGAQGSQPIFYQWSVDGVAVAGATNASFTLSTACGLHTVQASFTNAVSESIPVVSSSATLQGDANPTNLTFNTDGTGWQLNTAAGGSIPFISGNVLELTDGNSGEGSSAFYTVAQYVGRFNTTFTYTGNGSADGVAFIVQNSPIGVTSIGGTGGGLGYSGITNSIALEINLYSTPGIAPGTNGATFGVGGGAAYQSTAPVDLTSGDPINFTVNWAQGVLSVSMLDTITLASYSTSYVFGPLTAILGGSNLGYIGFSGGDGGQTAIQTISNFQFHSVITPVALATSAVTNGSFNITWPSTDPNYVLQVSSSLSSPSWTTAGTPVVVAGREQVTVNVTGGSAQKFYRLLHVACQ